MARLTHLLGRLARSNADELWFRGRERVRLAGEAASFALGRARWDRAGLRSRLLAVSPELAAVRASLARHDWSEANAGLRTHFLRRTPRFVVDPAKRREVSAFARRLFPLAVADAVRRADQLQAGRFDLLAYRGLSFRSEVAEIDWHRDPVHERRAPLRFWASVPYLDPRIGDHKIIWELNRHQHWLALGRAAWLAENDRHLAAIESELVTWLPANPPLTGVNWASMLEIALRCVSWVWALHFLVSGDADEAPELVDLLLGLGHQLDHVARHLSFYFSPNTHLLGEGLALYVAGRVIPEFRRASRWESIGRAILISEARAQVYPDGGHCERSSHYHRYALDFYLLALAIARRTNDPAAARFAEVTSRLAVFCRTMADGEGRLPAFGDDDGGMLLPLCGRPPHDASDSLWLAAAMLGRPELAVGRPPEEALWMLGPEALSTAAPSPRPQPSSRLFHDTGYAVLRTPEAVAILDAGPHGFLNGGHAHAGALSLVLTVHGRPLLIDAGTATYTMSRAVRDRFRSTAMHNTLVVDGRPQSEPAGPFHWKSRASARVDQWRPDLPADNAGRESAGWTYVEALHDGYLPLVHRRAVLAGPQGVWIVADHILGTGHHHVDAHWHFDLDWIRSPGVHGLRFVQRSGVWSAIDSTARTLRDLHGDEEGLGWCAPVYGQIVPTHTVCYAEAAEAPFSVITAIAADKAPVGVSVEPAPVVTEYPDGWHRAAVTVTLGGARLVALFAAVQAGEPDSRRSVQRVVLRDGEFSTDARVAVLSLSPNGEPSSRLLVDGSEAAWTPRSGYEVAVAGSSPRSGNRSQ